MRTQIRTEYSDVLRERDFKLWRDGDPSKRHLLSGIDGGRSFLELGIK
jgi:hypothetical protein